MHDGSRSATTTGTSLEAERELACRSSDGIEVRLLWDRKCDALTVHVFDARTGELLELPAGREQALDVFNHPFAYAPRAECLHDGAQRLDSVATLRGTERPPEGFGVLAELSKRYVRTSPLPCEPKYELERTVALERLQDLRSAPTNKPKENE